MVGDLTRAVGALCYQLGTVAQRLTDIRLVAVVAVAVAVNEGAGVGLAVIAAGAILSLYYGLVTRVGARLRPDLATAGTDLREVVDV